MLLTRRDIGWENQKSTSIRIQPKKVRTPKWSPPPPQLFWHHVSFFFLFSGQQQLRRISDYTIVDMRMNIRTHLCARFIFSRVPPASFQIFLASFEFIWILTVRLIGGGWIITQLVKRESLFRIPWRLHLLIGPVLADQLVYQFAVWKNQWRFEFNWFNSPFLVVLKKNCPAVDIYDVQTDTCTAQPT